MSQLILSTQSTAPSAPSTGKVSVYVDSNGDLSLKDASGNITKIAAAGSYTLTISSSGTLDLGGNTLAVSGGNPTITGGGTVALGGYTLTVPATGTAALLATANTFTQANTIPQIRSTTGVGLLDDTATSITFSGASSGILVFVSTLNANASGMVAFRVGSSLMCSVLAQTGTSVINCLTGSALTGTTSTDTKLNISAHTDNKLYIENRTGGAFTFLYQVIGVA